MSEFLSILAGAFVIASAILFIGRQLLEAHTLLAGGVGHVGERLTALSAHVNELAMKTGSKQVPIEFEALRAEVSTNSLVVAKAVETVKALANSTATRIERAKKKDAELLDDDEEEQQELQLTPRERAAALRQIAGGGDSEAPATPAGHKSTASGWDRVRRRAKDQPDSDERSA